jgi:hypothetical protein
MLLVFYRSRPSRDNRSLARNDNACLAPTKLVSRTAVLVAQRSYREDIIMATGFTILGYLAGILSLICFILVVMAMFQNDQRTMGIVCLALFFCTGLGYLLALIYGWIKSSEWGITRLMMLWTAAIVAGIVFYSLATMLGVRVASI